MKYPESVRSMIDEANRERDARVKVARALAKCPDDYSRRKVLRAVAILLDLPHVVGDTANV